jgi:hypothetical protein
MKRPIVFLLLLFVFASAQANELDKDKAQYEKSLRSLSVVLWKGTKVMIKGGADLSNSAKARLILSPKDSTQEIDQLIAYTNDIYDRIRPDSASIKTKARVKWDQVKLLSQLWKQRKNVLKNNEDRYPLLLSRLFTTEQYVHLLAYFKKSELIYDANVEHAYIALLAYEMPNVPTEIVNYELSVIRFDQMKKSMLKDVAMLLHIQTLIANKWYYLAEEKLNLLVQQQEAKSSSVFSKKYQHYFRALLFESRAFCRSMMKEQLSNAKSDHLAALKEAKKAKFPSLDFRLNSVTFNLLSDKTDEAHEELLELLKEKELSSSEVSIAKQANQYLVDGKKDEAKEILLNYLVQSEEQHKWVRPFVIACVDPQAWMQFALKQSSQFPVYKLFMHFSKVEMRNAVKAKVKQKSAKGKDSEKDGVELEDQD